MQQQEMPKHPKQEFQVERLAFFSDAVFAIAITLLIIEFKVPHVTATSTLDSVMHDLLELKFNFVALLISFYLIAMYWMHHHFLFKHIHNYNNRIVVANLATLLPIIFFPFTTAFLAESTINQGVAQIALRIFMLNHIFAGLSIYILYWLAMVHHKEFSFAMTAVEKIRFNSKVLFPTVLFIAVLTISYFHFDANIFTGALFIVAIGKQVLMRRLLNKARAADARLTH